MKKSKAEINGRQQRILDSIRFHGTRRVSELSEALNISEITVRRDLTALEEQSLVERFHGGARMLRIPEVDLYYEEKDIMHTENKILIAQRAASLVEEGDTIFLNSGTTALAVLSFLKTKNVKVVTNNALAPTMVDNTSIELIMTGGEYRERSKSLVSELATPVLNMVRANKCILGANGISTNCGVTTSVYQETLINSTMARHSKTPVIIIADGSKVGRSHSFTSFSIDSVGILITDSSADPDELEKIRARNVQIILADIK